MDIEEKLKNTKVFLFDLDGTIYIDDNLIGNVKETLNLIRKQGKRVGYITNNSFKCFKEYKETLIKLGIYDENDFFYSSLSAMIDYINENYKGKKVFPLARKSVIEEMKENGIKISDDADIVAVTLDKELTYEKLAKACKLLFNGATFISSHLDVNCPSVGGVIPDAGSIVALLEKASMKKIDVVAGKPNPPMVNNLIKRLGVKPNEITVVGDMIGTDIMTGINGDFNTVLVLSGDTPKEEAYSSKLKIDLITDNVNDLQKYLK